MVGFSNCHASRWWCWVFVVVPGSIDHRLYIGDDRAPPEKWRESYNGYRYCIHINCVEDHPTIHWKTNGTDSTPRFDRCYSWKNPFRMMTAATRYSFKLPSLKLTANAPVDRPGPKRKIIFQPSIFRCENVSFRECNYWRYTYFHWTIIMGRLTKVGSLCWVL